MKPIFRAIVFLVVLSGVLFCLGKLFDYAAKKDHREKAHWILSKRNGAYDFAVLGSSRSYVGVDISLLEKELQQKGINLSLDGTTYPEQYLAFKLFLAHNQIKRLILDANVFGFDNSAFKFPYHAYAYLPYVDNPEVFNSLRDNFGWKAYAWKYIPFFKNAEFNSKIGVIQLYTLAKSTFDKRTKETEFDKFGTRLLDKKFDEKALKNPATFTWKMEELPKKYFMQLLDLAKSNNIEVVIIAIPEYYEGMEKQTNRKEIMSFYESVAASNSIPFLPFDREKICYDKSKFYNPNHLNREGAREFTQLLSQQLAGKVSRSLSENTR